MRHSANVSMVFHPSPLPYHKNGFDSAQAAVVLSELSVNFIHLADALFDAQAAFQTTATVNVTRRELFEDIFAPIAKKVGVPEEQFLKHMNNDDPSNAQARVAWKF